MSLAEYTFNTHDDRLTLTVAGELRASSVYDIQEQVRDNLGDAVHQFYIDLSGITYMASMGLGLLAFSRRLCEETGKRLVISKPSDEALRMLEVGDLLKDFTIE